MKGRVKKMVEYKEIFKLKEMLEKANIPFEFIDHSIKETDFKDYQICYPVSFRSSDGRCVCSVIGHLGSYGSEEDLLEIMGLLTPEEEQEDTVKGWLTAENVFERIKNHYEEIKSGKHRDAST